MATLAETFVAEIERVFEPLKRATEQSPTGDRQLENLFAAIGVELSDAERDAVRSALDTFVSAYEGLPSGDDAASGDADWAQLIDVIEAVGDVVVAVETIASALDGEQPEDVVADLVEYLALVYLQREHAPVYYVGVLLTLIDVEAPPEEMNAGERRQLDLFPYKSAESAEFDAAQLEAMLDAPLDALRAEYLPDGPVDQSDVETIEARLFPWLRAAAAAVGFRLTVSDAALDPSGALDQPDVTYSRQVQLSLAVTDDLGFSLNVALAGTADGLRLLAYPAGELSIDESLGEWALAFDVGGETGPVLIHPDGIDPLEAASESEVDASLAVRKPPDPESGSAFVFGPADGTRLELGSVGATAGLTANADALDADVLASATNSELVVDPGEGDSFIRDVLPQDGLALDFDAGVGWSTGRGLYFEGGGGLVTDIPVNFEVGDVLSVETLQLAATVDPSGESVTVPVHVAADPQVSLGPIDAAVEGIGLEAEVAFPEESDGNLGPVDVEIGFKPPSGAGLSVDAGAVVGGGYLEFDPENQRYAGVLQLQVGELTLTAVGLLTTQLPGGRDGFSLLLIISGEFPPVQLGFGFTLNAVGGLLGLNRTIDTDYLVSGLGDGTVDSIMFPDDPVRNAPQIISDLRNGFPVATANHVFGPMARLGWGTPTVLSADIGVLMDLPDPIRIVVLGRVHAGFPHEEVAIVVFNMDVIGAVDFGEQTAAAQATLYDSRIVAYTLTGDMAMETGWGEDPRFVLSVGGFNPRFDPPEDFPELRRVALELGPGNPRVRWEGYFAMTANTVQVGANVEVFAKAAGFSLDGKMGFDTLFRFDPFELIADFYAGFAVRRSGNTLLSVKVDGTLAGPGPWSVSGNASFEIWPIEFDVSFDAEFGETTSSDELPPADVFGNVVGALGDERNWSAQRPEGGDSVVTLRQVEAAEGTVLAHPLGQFSVRQNVAPLGVRIDTYSGAKPAEFDRYEIVDVTVGDSDEDPDDPTREQFARGEYFDLTDDEKLEGPEFERYEAGRYVSNTGHAWGGREDADVLGGGVLTYETAVIDDQVAFQPIHIGRIAMPDGTAEALAAVGSVARGPLRTTGAVRYEVDEGATRPTGVDHAVAVADGGYVVARTEDLTRVDLAAVPADGTTKREAEDALDSHLASTEGDPDDYQVVGAHVAVDGEGDQ